MALTQLQRHFSNSGSFKKWYGVALLYVGTEHCGPKVENAVVRLSSDYVHGQMLSQNFSTAVAPHCGHAAFPK